MQRNNVPDDWRRKKDHYHLKGIICHSCGRGFIGQRLVCPQCGSDATLEASQYFGTGRVISYTAIYDPPAEFSKYRPYIMALVELEHRTLFLSQLVDVPPEAVRIGMRVETVFRKVYVDGAEGLIEYGTKFRPVLAEASTESV